MINNLQLLRNVGRFESVNSAASIALGRLTLIYAENGRGKTTLASILRSLATGDPIPVVERRRLAALHPPHIIIGCVGGPPAAMFQNGAWNRTLPDVLVFDDVFVDQNVYSGLVVGADHRQKLHELILGAQGVALNHSLQELIRQIETHNSELRRRADAIPSSVRGSMSIDDFCALPANSNIDQEIQAAERSLAASRQQDPIRTNMGFDQITIPAFDLASIESVLQQGVPNLDATAAARVQAHLETLGSGAEEWISEGVHRQARRPAEVAGKCVFCAQDLVNSPVISHYRAFFSDAYRQLQHNIEAAASTLNQVHSNASMTALERAVRILVQRRQFWERFTEIPEIQIDTVEFYRVWQVAREKLVGLLDQKRAAPLDPIAVPASARAAVQAHDENCAAIGALNLQLIVANQSVVTVKQHAATANPTEIVASLTRLQALKSRHTPEVAALCETYLEEKRVKSVTEQHRDLARAALEQYRASVFPQYQGVINRYLSRFNTGFSLDRVTATNTRGGPTCSYNVVINNTAVAVAGGNLQPGDHSFKNTLSAGDRNALALAFFFASIELDLNLVNKVVIIDDPVSSLDDHRTLTTVQEIRRLVTRVAQVVVLSHCKPFLCRVWDGADVTMRAALHVIRGGDGSTIERWNPDCDSITEHDRRHAALREFLSSGGQNEREIARAVRPLLEAFFRVACPEHFPPGTLLGPFRGLCDQRVNTSQQILNSQDVQELRDIIEFANRFHHDTNPAWESEAVNSTELTGFVSRALVFARRT